MTQCLTKLRTLLIVVSLPCDGFAISGLETMVKFMFGNSKGPNMFITSISSSKFEMDVGLDTPL